MLDDRLEILNTLGLHARAAAKLVSIASRHDCRVTVSNGQRQVDGSSIMGLLTLGAAKGSHLDIATDGPEEQQAMAEIQALFARKFDED